MVFQTHWSELQASICQCVLWRLWAGYLPTFSICPSYLEMPVLRIAVRPKNGYVRSWHDAPHSAWYKFMPFLLSKCFPSCTIKPHPPMALQGNSYS